MRGWLHGHTQAGDKWFPACAAYWNYLVMPTALTKARRAASWVELQDHTEDVVRQVNDTVR